MADDTISSEKEYILELAAQQIELYRRQGFELVSHHNRENSALDGYRGRQLLELVQNADDAGAEAREDCTLLFDISRERLVVANTGSPFSRKGLTSLVISDCSPKQLDRNRFIGSKGLGFRSILAWTSRPLVSSGQYEVVFDHSKAVSTVRNLTQENQELDEIVTQFYKSEGRWPVATMRFPSVPAEDDTWLQTARLYRSRDFDTVIVIPLPADEIGNEAYKEILDQLSSLPTSSLLFCRKLSRVEITGDLDRTWNILRQTRTQEHMTVVVEDNDDTELWQVHRRAGKIPSEITELHSGGRRDFEIAVAVPEIPNAPPNRSICVFFPTHETLPCGLVMHATLETTDDRNHLVDHASNREVLRQLASYVGEVLEEETSAVNPRRGLELLAGCENAAPQLHALGFVDALVEECSKRAIFPRLDGRMRPSTEVRQVPHAIWLDHLDKDLFPEVFIVGPEDGLTSVTTLFGLSWFEAATLKERLLHQLSRDNRAHAGEVLGGLLAAQQLKDIGAGGLLIGGDGKPLEDTGCFFTPTQKLPALPSWASSVHFVDADFQNGLLRGSKMSGLRVLALSLNLADCKIDEYGFEPVGRALVGQVEQGIEGDSSLTMQRWSELLPWLYEACGVERQALARLNIKVITTRGTLKRATTCYLGPAYPTGQIVWRLYKGFSEDEFVGSASDNGLGGPALLDIDKVEKFLMDLGVSRTPRLEQLRSGSDYNKFREAIVDGLDYPRTIRGNMCNNSSELRRRCRKYEIEGIYVPERWVQLLNECEATAIAAYLLSTGGALLSETDQIAKFYAKIENEVKLWQDPSVPIPNATLYFLRELEWVPAADGKRRRPSEIMLSSQGVKVLQGVYSRHVVDFKDSLIASYGGKDTLDSLLTRLGAVSSLETLGGTSLYRLLLSLPERDPRGKVAPGIYRTLVESSIIVEDSSDHDEFVKSGRMWGVHKGVESYLPISQLRYNANVTITKAIESHIPLVDIPRRKNTALVRQLFGITSLTSQDIQVELLQDGTEYHFGSEDANLRLAQALPYIYALRLSHTMDASNRELNLLRKATLHVCIRAKVSAKFPNGTTEVIELTESGERIAVGTSLVVIGEYDQNGPGSLTFWLTVADLVAELLGTEVADEVGGILRCHNYIEMREVLSVRLGSDADQKLQDAKSRFNDTSSEADEEPNRPIPPPKPAEQPSQSHQPSAQLPPGTTATPEDTIPTDPGSTEGGAVSFQPIIGPSSRPPKKRKLVITGSGHGSGGGRGPLATEEITLRIVEIFEESQGRFVIPVNHLHGADGFGCDLISVASQEIRDQAIDLQTVSVVDVLRYIEVKGRSTRAGEVELTDNEYRAAERETVCYFLYRVYVNPTRDDYYEIAVLSDPVNSKAVRLATRFNLADGSGAEWFQCLEAQED